MGLPIAKGLVKPSATPGVSDIFAANLRPSFKASTFRLTIILGGNSVVRVVVAGENVALGDLNNGVALQANRIYTFSQGVSSDLAYNFRLAVGVAVHLFQVDETAEGVI